MSSETFVTYFVTYLRWFLAGVFLFAGIAKARNLPEFATTIQLFRLVPRQLSNGLAHTIAIMEIAVGACLLAGVWTQWAARLAAVLLIIFIVITLLSVIRHNILNCNCFGPYFKERIGLKLIVRNVLLLMLTLIVLVFYDGFFALEFLLAVRGGSQAERSEPLFVLLTTIMSLIAILALVIRRFTVTIKLIRSER